MTNTPDSTEEKIRMAAKKLFTERGFEGTKIRDVAEEAGVNIALLNYYFRSKDKLFLSIFRENYQEYIQQSSDALLDTTIPFADRIRKFMDVMTVQMMQQPDLPMFILSEIHRNPNFCQEMMDAKRENQIVMEFSKHVQAEIKAGNIRPIDPMMLESILVSIIIFPFLSIPMMESMYNLTGEQFNQFLIERKKVAVEMVLYFLYGKA